MPSSRTFPSSRTQREQRAAIPRAAPSYGPTASGPSTEWRRIALDRQLTKIRFPLGVGVPALLALICLVVLGGLTYLLLGRPAGAGVSPAILESQRALVADLAASLDAWSARAVEDLERRAGSFRAQPGQDVPALLPGPAADGSWQGLTVLRTPEYVPVAATGEPIPVSRLAGEAIEPGTRPVDVGGVPAMLVGVPVDESRMLLGLANIAIRPLHIDTTTGQAIMLAAGPDHDLFRSQGVPVHDGDPILPTIRSIVSRDGKHHQVATADGPDQTRAVVVTTSAAGDSDIDVVSIVHVPVQVGGPDTAGFVAAGSLFGIAVCGYLMVHFGLVHPVRRTVEFAKGVASGAAGHRMRWPGPIEARRVVLALRQLSARWRGRSAPVPARFAGLPAALPVVVSAVLLLGWATTVMVGYASRTEAVPSQVVTDIRNSSDGVAGALVNTLESGRMRLVQWAAGNHPPGAASSESLAQLQVDGHFNSIYVIRPDGHIGPSVGRKPSRDNAVPSGPASGIHLDGTDSAVPVVFAYARAGDGSTVLGEFNVKYLARVLRRIDGHARLVDDRLRTIVDTRGYIAFDPLTDRSLVAIAAAASAGAATAKVAAVNDIDTIVVGTPLGLSSPADLAGWAVVVEKPVNELDTATNDARRKAWVVSLLGVSMALGFFGWQFFLVVRPLQAIAAAADRLVDGDVNRVIAPQRQDEIGALAVCLDICRQAERHGEQHLGGALRMRGSCGAHTVVMPRIPGAERPVEAADQAVPSDPFREEPS